MRGVFDEELEMPRTRRDAELTLGNGTLLLLFFGLVLVCGLCFGLGYSVGHRSASQAANPQPAAEAGAPLPASGAAAKPSATAQPVVQQPATAVVAPDSATPGASNQAATPSNQPQVRPALPVPQAGQPAASSGRSVQVSATPLTVQVAAVSHQEDADVLVGALRKRNYEVNARREGDGLIHVRIGPFRSRDDANRWRMKLLNDGYNAIVQP